MPTHFTAAGYCLAMQQMDVPTLIGSLLQTPGIQELGVYFMQSVKQVALGLRSAALSATRLAKAI